MQNLVLKPEQVRTYARRFLRGEPIPLFNFKADNFAIDMAIDEIIAARRRYIWKRRKDKQLMRGWRERKDES
jgi:hypothetical protein